MPVFIREFQNFFQKEYSRVKNVYYFSVALMFFILGWAVVDPFYSISMENIIQNTFLLGVFFSLWGFIRFFTDFFVGSLLDFFDNKKILMLAFAGYIVVGLGYYFINDVEPLFALRIFHVFVGSFFWVGVWSYTHNVSDKRYREESIMFEGVLQSLPTLFAPLIGVILISSANSKLIFLAVPFTSIIALVIMGSRAKSTRTRKKISFKKIIRKEFEIIRKGKKKLLAVFYVMAPLFFVSSSFAVYLPIYLYSQGADYLTIALFSIVMVLPNIFVLPLGKLADRKGRLPVFVAGTLLLTVGFLFFYFSESVTPLLACALIVGTGLSLISPTANALVGDLSGGGEKGVMSGFTETSKDLGQILGPLFGGLIVATLGFPVLVLFLSSVPVFMLLLALFFGKIPRTF